MTSALFTFTLVRMLIGVQLIATSHKRFAVLGRREAYYEGHDLVDTDEMVGCSPVRRSVTFHVDVSGGHLTRKLREIHVRHDLKVSRFLGMVDFWEWLISEKNRNGEESSFYKAIYWKMSLKKRSLHIALVL